MSGYEVEHNIKPTAAPEPPRRRPDLSTFFSALDQVDTSGSHAPNNAHSLPLPSDISAAFRLLANAFDTMRGGVGAGQDTAHDDLMTSLIETLMREADSPPTELRGCPDEFVAALDRVPKGQLREDQSCPICAMPFLDDAFPLVVRLPCHKDHMFDLECIEPWLKLNATCPMDRKTLWKRPEEKRREAREEDSEEEFDDMYA